MVTGLSKLKTRVSFVTDCAKAVSTGGKSEAEIVVDGSSCLVSTARLWRQECEEGNIPKSYCPEAWRPESQKATSGKREYSSPPEQPPVQEPQRPQMFTEPQSLHFCPNCNIEIELGANRCSSCNTRLNWEGNRPKIAEEKSPFVTTQTDPEGGFLDAEEEQLVKVGKKDKKRGR
jgi:hypothetical protein